MGAAPGLSVPGLSVNGSGLQSPAGPDAGPGLKLTPQLIENRPVDRSTAPTFVRGERVSGRPDLDVTVEGDAQLRKAGTSLTADRIDYNQVEDELEANGNVRYFSQGDLVTGPRLRLRVEAQQGYFLQPEYLFGRNEGRGRSDRLDFLGEGKALLTNSTYTTCPTTSDDWYLKADTITLDYGKEQGTGRNGVVYFKGVPILASPWLQFPLGEARQSGFLPPTFGITSTGGPEFLLPYYVNIAPNRDATLYPKAIARRGLQLGAEYRYLEPSYNGEARVEFLPDDRVADRDRWAVHTQQTGRLPLNLSYDWNIRRVSDKDYLTDFSRSISGVADTNLPATAGLGWGYGIWNVGLRATSYQVLTTAAPPYQLLPQLTVTGQKLDWNGFDVTLQAETTRFRHESFVNGTRGWAYPSIAYPIVAPGYFLTPKIGVHATQYELDQNSAGLPTRATRTVPIASVDSGLIFERDVTVFNRNLTQTLEPRLYYLRVPYRDQSKLPLFDTSVADFNFAQIFSENLFSGWDRIADANQLTLALTTRFLDPETGAQRVRATIGQRQYFNEQRVTLSPSDAARKTNRSDILASLGTELSEGDKRLISEVSLQYNPDLERVMRSVVGMRYSPGPKKTVSAGYRLIRQTPQQEGLEQLEFAAQWPLARRWYGVGRIAYSLRDSRPVETLLGVEYQADCWVMRVVGQRFAAQNLVATTVPQQRSTSSIFVQLELNGFARLGSNPMEVLRRSVPGYQVINPPIQPASQYDRYE
jgi:LPS-assembly protein